MKHNYLKTQATLLFLLAGVVIASAQSHLVLSEITLAPSTGEFIEIYNPTSSAINLDGYYIADNSSYAGLPEGGLMIALGDFIAAFPTGYVVQPNQAIVVAMGGTDFGTEYSVNPQFEIISQSATVPDMVSVGGSGTPALTNAGEAIVLFYWDGTSDLVKDVDIMYAGIPTSVNMLPAKTGVGIDGPDADAVPSVYLPDTATLQVQTSSPGIGYSTKRILSEEGYEIEAGGNGITGNDETSENTLVTWDSIFTAPTPGYCELATGVLEVSNPGSIWLFPNPTGSWITVQNTGRALVSITGMDGKIVYKQEIDGTQVIDLAGCMAGNYFVFIQTKESKQSFRIIKN